MLFSSMFHRGMAPLALACGLMGASAVAFAQAAAPAAAPAMSTPAVTQAAPQNIQQPAADAAQRKNVEDRLGVKVDSITRSGVANLYEVKVGNDLVYTDASGDYLFVGNIIDLRSRVNLTKARVDAIVDASTPKMKLADFPLDSAIKFVKGNGKRSMVVFADPNCGFCKRLETSLVDVTDVTVYVFLYPILGDDSVTKSKAIWCASDRAKTWNNWMVAGTPIPATKDCKTPLDKNVELGNKLQVNGTPTIFFASGKRVPGTLDADALSKYLAMPAS